MSIPIMKPIPGYPHYKASEDGRIWSEYSRKFLVSSPQFDTGYTSVELFENGKRKRFMVHRLIALAFIPNPNNYPVINHKNEIRDDNRASNLEWCTQKYNVNYGSCIEKRKRNHVYTKENLKKFQHAGTKAISKKTICVETGEVFESAKAASVAKGVAHSAICHVANGERKTAGGYHWLYI